MKTRKPTSVDGPKVVGDRDVGRVPAARHEDAAHARPVVPRVEGEPTPAARVAEVDLEPRAEVRGRRRGRSAEIGEVARAVPGRDVHAPTERDGEVREVAAHADPLAVRVEGRARGRRVRMAELEVPVHVVDDCLHPGPAARRAPEERPRGSRQPVALAVPAGEQVREGVVGQNSDGHLGGARSDLVGQPAVRDDEVRRQRDRTGWRDGARALVAERVDEGPERGAVTRRHAAGTAEIAHPRRMDAEERHHRRRGLAAQGDLVTGSDQHSRALRHRARRLAFAGDAPAGRFGGTADFARDERRGAAPRPRTNGPTPGALRAIGRC